jgi:hypothetical protein
MGQKHSRKWPRHVTDKEVDKGKGNGLEWAAAAMKGLRPSMEEEHTTELNIPGQLFCVAPFRSCMHSHTPHR